MSTFFILSESFVNILYRLKDVSKLSPPDVFGEVQPDNAPVCDIYIHIFLTHCPLITPITFQPASAELH